MHPTVIRQLAPAERSSSRVAWCQLGGNSADPTSTASDRSTQPSASNSQRCGAGTGFGYACAAQARRARWDSRVGRDVSLAGGNWSELDQIRYVLRPAAGTDAVHERLAFRHLRQQVTTMVMTRPLTKVSTRRPNSEDGRVDAWLMRAIRARRVVSVSHAVAGRSSLPATLAILGCGFLSRARRSVYQDSGHAGRQHIAFAEISS